MSGAKDYLEQSVLGALISLGSLSTSRKCLNIVRTMTEFVTLKALISSRHPRSVLDHYINVTRRLACLAYWMLDVILLLHRMGIVRCSLSAIFIPQMYVYLLKLALALAINLRKHRGARRLVRIRSESIAEETQRKASVSDIPLRNIQSEQLALIALDPEIRAAYRKKTMAILGVIKAICDSLSAIQASGLLKHFFGTSLNESLISIASSIRATLTTYTLKFNQPPLSVF